MQRMLLYSLEHLRLIRIIWMDEGGTLRQGNIQVTALSEESVTRYPEPFLLQTYQSVEEMSPDTVVIIMQHSYHLRMLQSRISQIQRIDAALIRYILRVVACSLAHTLSVLI